MIRLICWLVIAVESWHVLADDFPTVKNSPTEANLLPMPAEKAAATMTVPAGFQLNLFAAEPQVQNPIALALDERQRVWIAENYTYSDRTERFDMTMRDRVLIFEDTDGDGRADKRTVFTDQVQMLTSVELGRGGVWLMCPPRLLYIPDANQDDQPDGPPQVMLDGFEVAQDNYHNFANGLRWGPDGWLYGRCGHSCPGWIGIPGTPAEERIPIDGGLWRFHPEHKAFEVLCHGTVNPWGHDWDKFGELFFVNTVIGHLWHMMPGAHMKESFGESMNRDVYQRMDMIADHYHFDTQANWSESRDGKANDLGGGHAHIGAAIYKGQQWPAEYHGRLFTVNMHGRRINAERLERQGAGYVGKHEKDLVIAADPFFRGLDLRIDNRDQAYIIDWSDTGECHESTGVHRTSGRIYRLSYPTTNQSETEIVTKRDIRDVNILDINKLDTAERLAWTWLMYRDGRLETDFMLSMLDHPDEHIRVWGIRLLSDLWPLDTILGPKAHFRYPDINSTVDRLVALANRDESGLVQLTLASTLQRLPLNLRARLAAAIVAHGKFADDRDLPLLTWYGVAPLGKSRPDELTTIAAVCTWPKLHRFIARKLAVECETSPEPLTKLLGMAGQFSEESQQQVLLGLRDAYQGLRKVARPEGWEQFSKLPSIARESDVMRRLNTLFGDGQTLDEIRSIVVNNRAEMQTRQRALETLIEARPEDMRAVCESLIDTRILNGTALRGLALVDDPAVGRLLAQKFKRFQPEDRPLVMETLVSRRAFAAELLKVMGQKGSPILPSDLSPFQARQILSHNDAALSRSLADVWGQLRETPAQRRQLIDQLKKTLTSEPLTQADLSAGRSLFEKTCSQCHRLHGQGKQIGPDLTGSQRTNLDYLLENIVDPSAVVAKNYRMSKVLTDDGRVVSGLIVSRQEKTLTIQTPTALEVIAADDIEKLEETSLSPMPEGLLETLSPDQVRDLMAYLMRS